MSRVTVPSLGWLVIACGVACMGASFALAQRAKDPTVPEAVQPERGRAVDPAAKPPARERDAEREAQPPVRERDADRPPQPRDRESLRDTAEESEVQEGKRPRQLGIQFDGPDDLTIREVAPGSMAADAGLRPQDRIVSIDGRPITGQRRFTAFLSGLLGRRVPVVIERNGRQYTVQFTSSQSAGDGPWLGVFLQDNEENQQGAVVTHIYPAGPAARAGLRPGDVILKVNDQDVQSTPDLIAAIDGFKARDKVNLRILRGEQELDAVAVLAQRGDFAFHTSYGEDREPRGQQPQDDDPFGNIPRYAMQLEHDRRMAEQHERIETELRKLQEEVRLLREAIERK